MAAAAADGSDQLPNRLGDELTGGRAEVGREREEEWSGVRLCGGCSWYCRDPVPQCGSFGKCCGWSVDYRLTDELSRFSYLHIHSSFLSCLITCI